MMANLTTQNWTFSILVTNFLLQNSKIIYFTFYFPQILFSTFFKLVFSPLSLNFQTFLN